MKAEGGSKTVTVRLIKQASYLGPGQGGKTLKRGVITEIPEEAFNKNKDLGKIVQIISRGFKLIHLPSGGLRLVLPNDFGAIHWAFIKLRALMVKCGAEQFDAVIQRRAGEAGVVHSFVAAHPDVRNIKYVEPRIQVPATGFLVGGDGFDFDYALDPQRLADAGITDIAYNFLSELPCDWHYLRTWPCFFEPTKKKRNAVALLMGRDGAPLALAFDEWQKLADEIKAVGVKVLAAGLPEDREFAESICSGTHGLMHNMINKSTTFSELVTLLRECRGVVANGSYGMTLLAAASNIKTLGLYSPGPYGPLFTAHQPARYWPMTIKQPYSIRDVRDEVIRRLELNAPFNPNLHARKKPKSEEQPQRHRDAEPIKDEGGKMKDEGFNPQLPKAKDEQMQELRALMVERGKSEAQVLAWLEAKHPDKSCSDLDGPVPVSTFDILRAWLKKSRKVKK